MDGATLQAKIYAGRAKAAARIGLSCRQYRPLSAGAPLGNQVGTIPAAFNAGDSTYRSPNLPGDAIWYADLDGRVTLPGDYLQRVADGQVYFIAGQQPLLPIICIECNRTVRISRQTTSSAVGQVGYSGTTAASETNTLGAPNALWPASILLGGKLNIGINLPAGGKQTGWRILLPPSVPASVVLNASDIVTDDLGRRYLIDGAELTDLGWRINANELHT